MVNGNGRESILGNVSRIFPCFLTVRQLLTSLLWLSFCYPAIAGSLETAVEESLPLTPRTVSRHSRMPSPDTNTAFREVRQTHNARNAWTFQLNKNIIRRPELLYWMEHWSSPQGLLKLKIALERWHPYRHSVQKILRESGLPWEILAIPIVESNWKIDAVSSSGAAGPWQFIEKSARGRNLQIDYWRDDRRDVWRATQAAMEELSFNYSLFLDWFLAIASYNAGATRIRNLLAESGLNDFWELLDSGSLPSETAHYVPQVIAVARIISDAGRFGLPVVWENSPRWSAVEIPRSTPLPYISASTDLDIDTLKTINSELIFPITPPSSSEPYFLKVPAEKAARIEQWLKKTKDSEPERFWHYVVKPGNTLSEIAQSNQIPLGQILKYNPGLQAHNLLPGNHIYIPASQGITTPPPGMEEESIPDWTAIYRIKEGDTLWSVSRRANTTPEEIARVNGIRVDSLLSIGSPLKVPFNPELSSPNPLPISVDRSGQEEQ